MVSGLKGPFGLQDCALVQTALHSSSSESRPWTPPPLPHPSIFRCGSSNKSAPECAEPNEADAYLPKLFTQHCKSILLKTGRHHFSGAPPRQTHTRTHTIGILRKCRGRYASVHTSTLLHAYIYIHVYFFIYLHHVSTWYVYTCILLTKWTLLKYGKARFNLAPTHSETMLFSGNLFQYLLASGLLSYCHGSPRNNFPGVTEEPSRADLGGRYLL